VDAVRAEATLALPARAPFRWYGKQGRPSEPLGSLQGEMQQLPRMHAGATW
jgi:hypothetical protein